MVISNRHEPVGYNSTISIYGTKRKRRQDESAVYSRDDGNPPCIRLRWWFINYHRVIRTEKIERVFVRSCATISNKPVRISTAYVQRSERNTTRFRNVVRGTTRRTWPFQRWRRRKFARVRFSTWRFSRAVPGAPNDRRTIIIYDTTRSARRNFARFVRRDS